jgi:hypothetical protein
LGLDLRIVVVAAAAAVVEWPWNGRTTWQHNCRTHRMLHMGHWDHWHLHLVRRLGMLLLGIVASDLFVAGHMAEFVSRDHCTGRYVVDRLDDSFVPIVNVSILQTWVAN